MPKELIQLDLLELAATQDTKPSPRHRKPFVHHCHAVGCDKQVPPKMLMCPRHWRMVPKALQQAVWANYAAGQEITKTPSAEYLKAAQAAISAVQKAESLPAPTATRFAPGDGKKEGAA